MAAAVPIMSQIRDFLASLVWASVSPTPFVLALGAKTQAAELQGAGVKTRPMRRFDAA